MSPARPLARWGGDKGRLVEFPEGDHNSIFAYNGAEILDTLLAFREQLGL